MTRGGVYLCFFLSGLSGLVNEVVWSRLFVYTMGSSQLSIAVVVAVFMGGLSLGSSLGGPLADRAASPLRMYGLLVAAAGAFSGAVAPLLWLAQPLIGWVYRLHDGQPDHSLFTVTKALVCAATILVPATLMGATLPALARHLTRRPGEIGASLGTLYAVNTFGAVAGAAAAGFFLIGSIGLAWSAALAAAIDVAVGGAVLLLTPRRAPAEAAPAASTAGASARAGKPRAQRASPSAGEPASEPGGEHGRWALRISLLAFGLSGFVNMCLQLGWTRALIISIGNSTYAFSVIVAVFIFGLAAGGWIAGLFADRLRRPMAAFGWLLLAIAAAAGATIPWLGHSPARFAFDLYSLSQMEGFSFPWFLLAAAGQVALVILPATVLMGMTLPLAGRVQSLAMPGVGRAVGTAYAANTVGAILGTALSGFVFIRLLGRIWALLYLAVGLGGAAGVLVLAAAPGKRRAARWAVLGPSLAGLLALAYLSRPAGVLDSPEDGRSLWHPVLFAQGAYLNYSDAGPCGSAQGYIDTLLRSFESVYYRDGEAASVAVMKQRFDGSISLNIAGKPDASAGPESIDRTTQLLLGHLPLLVHPSPRRALDLGLGGGMTLGAMTLHPALEEIDLLEISPEVEEAARLFFAGVNHDALNNPRVRKIIGDGRNHLAHTERTYDVISSEPSNFWIAGLGNLFTEEFYRIVLKHLNPGGIACQWMYAYSIRSQDYRTALRTFTRIFPHVMVWSDNRSDTVLLGSREPMTLSRERIALALSEPALRSELATLGVREPEDLLRYFKAEGPALAGWIGDGPTNRDLFPVLEFSSPLGFFEDFSDIQLSLDKALPPALPAALFRGFSSAQIAAAAERWGQGRALTRVLDCVNAARMEDALEHYRVLAALADPWTIDHAAHELAAGGARAVAGREAFFDLARRIQDTPELCMADGYRLLAGTDLAALVAGFRRFNEAAAPQRWQPYLALARLEASAMLLSEASRDLEMAERHEAPAFRSAALRGILAGMRGDLPASERSLREALRLAPDNETGERGESAYNLGFCLERQGRADEALKAYGLAMTLGNDPVRAWIATARCHRGRGRAAEALEASQAALQAAQERKQDSGEARAEIARALAGSGRIAQAIEWMKTAAQISPSRYQAELDELSRRQ